MSTPIRFEIAWTLFVKIPVISVLAFHKQVDALPSFEILVAFSHALAIPRVPSTIVAQAVFWRQALHVTGFRRSPVPSRA